MLLCVVGSCCAKVETGQTFSHVQTDAITHKIVGPAVVGVVASFTRNLACVAFVPISFAPLHPIPSRFSCPSPTWLKADTHGGFCSRSVLQAHFARVSTYEGALSSSLNLPREFAPKYLTG